MHLTIKDVLQMFHGLSLCLTAGSGGMDRDHPRASQPDLSALPSGHRARRRLRTAAWRVPRRPAAAVICGNAARHRQSADSARHS